MLYKDGEKIYEKVICENSRTITHASLIELDPMKSLPKVKGDDDAEKAFLCLLTIISI